jgi:hypothetical protein
VKLAHARFFRPSLACMGLGSCATRPETPTFSTIRLEKAEGKHKRVGGRAIIAASRSRCQRPLRLQRPALEPRTPLDPQSRGSASWMSSRRNQRNLAGEARS